MKKRLLIIFLVTVNLALSGQNTVITDDDSYAGKSSAVLDVYSESKGLLVPRLSTSQINGINPIATGLLVFNTDSAGFYFYTGANWLAVSSGQFLKAAADSVVYFPTDKYVGVGTRTPMSKLSVQASSTNSNVPLFDVKNQAGDVIFAVYESGVEINFNEDAMAKGAKGGFAVGGLSTGKAGTKEYLRITPDSVRIYFDDASGKGAKGGFAVGGLSTGKALGNKYFTLSDTNARIDLRRTAKGAKGGFAVGGLSTGKVAATDLLVISPDSARIYIDSDAKGAKGGFAVGGLSTGKVGSQDYLRITRDSARMYLADPAKGAKGGFAVGGLSTGKANLNFLDLTPENYFIGHQAGSNNTTGIKNSFIGYQSGVKNDSGVNNIFIGEKSGYNNINGYSNIFIGNKSGYNNIGGDYWEYGSRNIFIGVDAGLANTIGGNNIFIGQSAGFLADTGKANIFIGQWSGKNNRANSNIFFGTSAGEANTYGEKNLFFGNQTGQENTTGSRNMFLGYLSGISNIDGSDNVYIGAYTGSNRLHTSNNTIIGSGAGQFKTTGQNNVYLGFNTGRSAEGNNCVFIGPNVGSDELNDNRLYIDNQQTPAPLIYGEFDNNYLRVNGEFHSTGNGRFENVTSGAHAFDLSLTADGSLTTQSSDKRLKTNIIPFKNGLEKVMQLKPVSFNWKKNPKGKTKIGLIAQDVEKILPEFVFTNKNDGYKGINYSEFSAVLIGAMQQQQQQIEELKKANEELRSLIEKTLKKE